MASTGWFTPGGQGSETVEINMPLSLTDDVGMLKLGAINDLPNSVAGYAIRQKVLSFDINTASQTAIAHGCTDSEGNAVAPILVSILYSNSATVHSSQAPDTTNIYLTDANGGTTAATGQVVVLY